MMAYSKGKRNPTFQKNGFIIHQGYRIRKLKFNSNPYQLDLGVINGKHIRLRFNTVDEAKDVALQKRIEITNSGASSLNFTEAMKKDSLKAMSILKPFKLSLSACAEYYAKHNTSVDYDNTIEGLVNSFLKDKKVSGIREKTYEHFIYTLTHFKNTFADLSAEVITHSDLDNYLSNWDNAPSSRKARRVSIGTFFNYVKDKGIIETNPTSRVKKKSVLKDKKSPSIWKVDEVKLILDSASVRKSELVIATKSGSYSRDVNNPFELYLYLAIGFFSGIRPDEILRLKWEDINFKSKQIEIRSDTAKERKPRIVEIYPNLIKIIKDYQKDFAISNSDYVISIGKGAIRYRRTQLMKELGLAWKQDAMRHSFATYHLAKYGTDKTRRLLGHTVDQIMWEYYIGYAENLEQEGDRYFEHTSKTKLVKSVRA